MNDIKICCICGKPFVGYGNNPVPVSNSGVCCDPCNIAVVVPARALAAQNAAIIAAADKITSTLLQRAESGKLNALVGKLVEVEFIDTYDGDIEVGVLHKDTLATYTKNPDADNAQIRGYWLDRVDGEIHFKKSHVKSITEAAKTDEKINDLIGKSVFIKFVDGSVAAGFFHRQIIITDNGAPITHYYVETPLRRIRFYASDIKTIRER